MNINRSGKDFHTGMQYVFKGITKFYSLPGLYLYALIPLLFAGIFYFLAFYAVFYRLLPAVSGKIHAVFSGGYFEFLGKILVFLLYCGTGIGLTVLMAVLASSLFEFIGAYFMSRMVRVFEKDQYGKPNPQIPIWKDFGNALSCAIYAAVTLLIYLFLFIAGLFIPLLPQIGSVFLLGRRYAVSYCAESAFNRNLSLSELVVLFSRRPGLRSGFGAGCFLLLLIPVFSILFIPGFMIGGAMLMEQEL